MTKWATGIILLSCTGLYALVVLGQGSQSTSFFLFYLLPTSLQPNSFLLLPGATKSFLLLEEFYPILPSAHNNLYLRMVRCTIVLGCACVTRVTVTCRSSQDLIS